MSLRCYSIILFYLLAQNTCYVRTVAQTNPFQFPTKQYPSGTYVHPVNFPISLAGNFGECRPDHFHSGIDIRTRQIENQFIYAIKEGYVSRIKIEAGGFGNAIYITQPDGYTTVYAHLNRFMPALESYVHEQQYKAKSWKIDLMLSPTLFPVKQGQFIAWSGNTGSSEGPHLHLEIRDTKSENPLNPLLFFSDIEDHENPKIQQVALYDAHKSIYEQEPLFVSYAHRHRLFRRQHKIITIESDKVYLGIEADDYMKGALGTLGVYEMLMTVDQQPSFAWQLDNISYDSTRYMNAHADYKIRKQGGKWIQLCHALPNDKLNIYQDVLHQKGCIDLSDGAVHTVSLIVRDVKGNADHVRLHLKGKRVPSSEPCQQKWEAGTPHTEQQESIKLSLDKSSLYDHLCFRADLENRPQPYAEVFHVHEDYVPVHTSFLLQLQPSQRIPLSLQNKLVIQHQSYGRSKSPWAKAASYQNGRVQATVREFGAYKILPDTIAPSIRTSFRDGDIITHCDYIDFEIKDELSSVKQCTLLVDEQWLRLVQKGDVFYYELDSYFPAGTHRVVIKAIDENDNVASRTFTFVR
jgi:hypothetical protein